jgi:hypothetical protein
MRKLFFYSIILCLSITACQFNSGKSASEKDNESIVLKVFPEEKPVILLSSFVDSVVFIPLENHGPGLVAEMVKIQSYNGNYYILDKAQNALFVYDKKGQLLLLLNQQGRGPGEYLQPVDFEINDKGLFVLDYPNSILQYDFELKFVQKIVLTDIYSFSFASTADSLWVSNENGSERGRFHYSIAAMTGETKRNFLEKKFLTRTYNWGGISEFKKHAGELYCSPPFQNEIFKTDGNGVIKKYDIAFGKTALPESLNPYEAHIYSPDFQYAVRQNFWVTDNYFIFDYFYKGQREFAFYNTENQTLQHGAVENDLHPDYRFLPTWNSDNKLIEIVDASTLNAYFAPIKSKVESLRAVASDDNCVLVLYFLKP